MQIEELYQKFKISKGVTTDTRKIGAGQLFFALKGEKFNANEFALQALEAGAAFSVIDEENYATDPRCILVNDVLETLQKLANFHRKTFDIPVIGLTGSNGKTTNKELLTRVLSKKFRVHATKGNLNNHIGVPLTLLEMPTDTEMAVIEMGANHQKEIEMLCGICEPTHGFITNLGKAHLEGFGGEEGVRKGKGELFDFLKNNRGTAFVNQTDEKVVSLAKEKNMMLVVYYGADEFSLKMTAESPTVSFQIPESEYIYTTHIGGKYNFDNMQTAFSVGRFFGVSHTDAAQAIADYNPDNNRSQVIEKGSNSYLMDAYNANPSSMAASVKNFGNLKTEKKKVVILGDMFELGEYSQAEHSALGKLVSEQDFEIVVLYGENMKHALAHLPKAYYFTDKFSLHNWLIEKAFANTYFLVKGSRGVGLESVLTVM
ncbi:MAG: UDP-N-acetylmuramoyl-tripeptide--D-alanyl-D-alanine ligase [Cytophagaceae bacterium]|nr:UDP-N-acetylmuramoyl-tripeptide--D-alanyl-D-alanine ligase [Cytophagaceae bacterium]